MPLLLHDLTKHEGGGHDQISHGSWAHGGVKTAVESVKTKTVSTADRDAVRFARSFRPEDAGFSGTAADIISDAIGTRDIPSIMYHVAPSSVRDSIARSGLRPEETWNTGAGGGIEYRNEALYETPYDGGEPVPFEYRPEGVYLFRDYDAAVQYRGNGDDDIYVVNAGRIVEEGGRVIRDPVNAHNWDSLLDEEQTFVTRVAPASFIERIRDVDVAKHEGGGHEQLSHGNWARGRVSAIVDESLRRAKSGKMLDVDALKLFLPYGHMDASTPQDDLAKIVKAQGWDQPAPLLSDEEFKAAYDTGKFTLVYRIGPIGLEQGILNGTPYIGTGVYGPGTYVTDNYLGVTQYRPSIDKSRAVVPMLMPTEMVGNPDEIGEILHHTAHRRAAGVAAYEGDPAPTKAAGALRTIVKRRDDGTPYSEYLVFNTSALLVGRPSEFPEPGSINFYIEDRPRGEVVDWARFEKADGDVLEDGPYWMLVDGKAVPITVEQMQKHEGGEGHEQKSHGSWAWGRAENLYMASRNFRSKGGDIEMADPEEMTSDELRAEIIGAEEDIVATFEDIGQPVPSEISLGIYYAKQGAYGLEDGYDVFVARSQDGTPVGLLSGYQRSEDEYEIVYLGSTGAMSGVGSALVMEAISRAAESGLGIRLVSEESAEDWWSEQVGMEFALDEEEGDIVGSMDADKVEQVARALTEYRRKG